MYAMRTLHRLLFVAAAAIVATSCSFTLYTSSSAYDDLYATHDRVAIANRQKAEAEAATKAEAAATANVLTDNDAVAESNTIVLTNPGIDRCSL